MTTRKVIVTALLLVAAAPAAAQWVDPQTCSQGTAACDSARRAKSDSDASYAETAKHRAQAEQAEHDRQRRALLKTPPLPAERNALLGSWRLDAGQRSTVGGPGQGSGRDAVVRELFGALSIDRLKDIGCEAHFRGGVSFTPSTYTLSGTGGVVGGPIAYRAGQRGAKPVIVAIPNDGQARMMDFEIASASRIVYASGCVLVRVDAPASKAAADATTAPGDARTAVASSSAPPAASAMPQVAAVAPAPPPSTLSRPSQEVCRNNLLDKLGTVGSNQVRAMSDVRFKEAAIEGKVPNSNNLRIDLRGSACDDPRLKATLYDFDANEMLQSITYVWERPAGPAPAPIFNERARLLANWYAPGPTPSPSRWQGTSTTARVTLQDLPERALLLEAYAAPK
jgi:hypothetical protein